MIDIDAMERRITHRDDEPLLPPSPEEVLALIAEIRRLRGESKGHRKCPCGGKPVAMVTRRYWVECEECQYWVKCEDCQCGTDFCNTPEEAWAAWDGVE